MMRGAAQHKRRLQRLAGPEALNLVGQALYAGGQLIENYAAKSIKSITNGAVSGKGHIPSNPGEPPNADTNVLDRNIETVQVSNVLTEVSSNAPYAGDMEFGNSKVEARPYMRPARDAMRPRVNKLFTKALSKAVKISGA